MHSEPIASREATDLAVIDQKEVNRRGQVTRRRLLLGGLELASGAVGLTACSTGSSREAERGRTRDAERTSVVDSMQATRTASLIFGTPPATPSTLED